MKKKFTNKRSFSRLHSMSKDGRYMSSMQVTLRAGVTNVCARKKGVTLTPDRGKEA